MSFDAEQAYFFPSEYRFKKTPPMSVEAEHPYFFPCDCRRGITREDLTKKRGEKYEFYSTCDECKVSYRFIELFPTSDPRYDGPLKQEFWFCFKASLFFWVACLLFHVAIHHFRDGVFTYDRVMDTLSTASGIYAILTGLVCVVITALYHKVDHDGYLFVVVFLLGCAAGTIMPLWLPILVSVYRLDMKGRYMDLHERLMVASKYDPSLGRQDS